MDYVQNKNVSMINEHKRAISEKKNWFTFCIILMDYVQNKNVSMINEHKRAISEKKNLKVTN